MTLRKLQNRGAPTGKCPGCQRRVKQIPFGHVIAADEKNEFENWQCTNCGVIVEFIMGKWQVVGRDRIVLVPGELSAAANGRRQD